MVDLDKWEGHVVLLCKNHYNVIGVDIFTALKRVWGIRCGVDFLENDNSPLEYIANFLYKIIQKCNPEKTKIIHEIMHNACCKTYLSSYSGLSPIEMLIKVYREEILMLSVRKEDRILIKLPKPQNKLFTRIVKGLGNYKDYELVK